MDLAIAMSRLTRLKPALQSREHALDRPCRGMRPPAWAALLLAMFVATICAAQSVVPAIEVSNPPNDPAQQAKHYVILVSLDGFRYDYATKYGAKNLLAMAARGASAPAGMLPSYPSVTFPNHY